MLRNVRRLVPLLPITHRAQSLFSNAHKLYSNQGMKLQLSNVVLSRAFCSKDKVSTTADVWNASVSALFEKMESGLQQMRKGNPTFEMTKEKNDDNQKFFINLGEAGWFIFISRPDTQELSMQSPLSGLYVYKYDASRDWWVNVNDDHNILEMFSRDIMQLASGYPTF